jgi:hypothetical protein
LHGGGTRLHDDPFLPARAYPSARRAGRAGGATDLDRFVSAAHGAWDDVGHRFVQVLAGERGHGQVLGASPPEGVERGLLVAEHGSVQAFREIAAGPASAGWGDECPTTERAMHPFPSPVKTHDPDTCVRHASDVGVVIPRRIR